DVPRQAGERIAGRQRDHQRDQYNHQPDERRVAHPAQVAGVVQQEAVARERRMEAPDLRRVVHRRLRLERRHRHPEEREGEQDRERHHDAVREGALAEHVHVTSARRAKTSMPMTTSASTGTMKSAIAAPSPMLPALIPVWNDQVVSTCVELNGPPFVRMYGTTMSVA